MLLIRFIYTAMGKKSKKRQQHSSQGPAKLMHRKDAKPTLLDDIPETKDNLRFEDPYEDVYENEIDEGIEQNVGGTEDMNENGALNSDDNPPTVQSWNPLSSEKLDPGTKLEIDDTAYKMHHSMTPDWPSLSFDIIRDNMGDQRTRFPHTMTAVVGTQAEWQDKNKLTVMKLSDLARTGVREKTEKEIDDEHLGEEYDAEDDDVDSDDEEEIDLDPVLEHFSLKHSGGVNRVRSMPQKQEIVATWSDKGCVNLFNIGGILDNFERSSNTVSLNYQPRKIIRDPFFVYQGHRVEGYALDWSKVNEGSLATGDCNGNIHLWESVNQGKNIWNNSSFKVNNAYSATSGGNIDNPSVEDIQWSPTEATVLAAAECGGYVRIYDTRCKGRSMIANKIHENGADVNVISWNPIITNLLASGGDDGVFSVWDLRKFQPTADGNLPQPLARFTSHKKPITSVEWHPTDESMIVLSDEDATYIYDLSIEEDIDAMTDNQPELDGIPPQLLFVHCGSTSTKEAHWHPQISSLIMTTALSGYNIFIPSNL